MSYLTDDFWFNYAHPIDQLYKLHGGDTPSIDLPRLQERLYIKNIDKPLPTSDALSRYFVPIGHIEEGLKLIVNNEYYYKLKLIACSNCSVVAIGYQRCLVGFEEENKLMVANLYIPSYYLSSSSFKRVVTYQPKKINLGGFKGAKK